MNGCAEVISPKPTSRAYTNIFPRSFQRHSTFMVGTPWTWQVSKGWRFLRSVDRAWTCGIRCPYRCMQGSLLNRGTAKKGQATRTGKGRGVSPLHAATFSMELQRIWEFYNWTGVHISIFGKNYIMSWTYLNGLLVRFITVKYLI